MIKTVLSLISKDYILLTILSLLLTIIAYFSSFPSKYFVMFRTFIKGTHYLTRENILDEIERIKLLPPLTYSETKGPRVIGEYEINGYAVIEEIGTNGKFLIRMDGDKETCQNAGATCEKMCNSSCCCSFYNSLYDLILK